MKSRARGIAHLQASLRQLSDVARLEDLRTHREELDAAAEELRAQLDELTARLERLERANRDAAELIERERTLRRRLDAELVAKDRFLAVAAHDLRAPVNAVLGWTELLRRETLDHRARDRALATVERNARAQLRILEDLLDIARIGADSAQLERAPVVLDELVQRCVDGLAPTAHDHEVTLTYAAPREGRLVVMGDARRVEKVLAKLLGNALDATPPGGRVTASVTREGAAACVSVEDSGRGIPRHVLAQLFEPAPHGAYDPLAGEPVGLGLYIARRTVELHDGTIRATSDGPGTGARFTITLPLLAAAAGAAPAAPDVAPAASEAAPPSVGPPSRSVLHGARVLVVDDEEDARELLSSILRQRGATVTAASDVGSALAAFDAAPHDVVVSDVGMPGRDGFDLARELRARPAAGATLIAVSGFAAPDEIDRALGAGFDMHLAKPIEPAELVSAIHDAMRAKVR